MDKFSHDLAAECRHDGVIIQSVMPTLLATKMYGFQDTPSLCVPSPDEFVEANLLTLGIESRTAAYWVHKILVSSSCTHIHRNLLFLTFKLVCSERLVVRAGLYEKLIKNTGPLLSLFYSCIGERFCILSFLDRRDGLL